MERIPVSVDNFARAEADRMLADLAAAGGGINRWFHNRAPTDVDDQAVVRMNRDTLYSWVVADLAQGAVLAVPHTGERYMSVMVVNQDHHINEVFHSAGEYRLTMEAFDTRYVLLAARVFVDPTDPADGGPSPRCRTGSGCRLRRQSRS